MSSNYLLYTIITYRKEYYVPIFEVMLKSMVHFGKTRNYDLCIITNKDIEQDLRALKQLKHVASNVFFHIVPVDTELFPALMRKCDIASFSRFLEYDKILYLDTDLIIQGDLVKDIFEPMKCRRNVIYGPESGTHEHKFWSLGNYTAEQVATFKQTGVKPFSTGSFIFRPSKVMQVHFQAVKDFALKWSGSHFYDQSFFNVYFNTRNMSSTKYWKNKVLGFPDYKKDYPSTPILHFCGIGDYKRKKHFMAVYLKRQIRNYVFRVEEHRPVV
jgi:lipopolysaccharide biosynthesis glycosyltransferase